MLLDYEREAKKKGLKYGTKEYIEFVYEKKGYGLQDHDITELVPGIDVLIGGHSHTGLFPPYEDPRNHTLVIQAYSKGSALGRLDLAINKEYGSIVEYKATNYTPFTDQVKKDEDVDKMIREYIEKAEKELKKVIGVATKKLTRGNDETALGNVIADAMREEYDADFALFNRGGMRKDIPAGDITGKELFECLPFGNTATVVKLKGWHLIRILQVGFSGRRRDTQISGVNVVYNPEFSTTNKLCSVEFSDGSPIELEKEYTAVTSNYLASGSIGYDLFKFLEKEDKLVPIRDVLKNFIKKHTPITPNLDGRIKRVIFGR